MITIVVDDLIFTGKEANRLKNCIEHKRGLERRIKSAERRQLPYLGLLKSEYSIVLHRYHQILAAKQNDAGTDYFLAHPETPSNPLPGETDPGDRPNYTPRG